MARKNDVNAIGGVQAGNDNNATSSSSNETDTRARSRVCQTSITICYFFPIISHDRRARNSINGPLFVEVRKQWDDAEVKML